MQSRPKRLSVQQVVIPRGVIKWDEAAVIEIPKRYTRNPVVIVKRKVGDLSVQRAASHFVKAPVDLLPLNVPQPKEKKKKQPSEEASASSVASSVQDGKTILAPNQTADVSYYMPPDVQERHPQQRQTSAGFMRPPVQEIVPYQSQIQSSQMFPPSQQYSGFAPKPDSYYYQQQRSFGCPPGRCSSSKESHCSGQVDLERKERMEQEQFSKSLDEFQRARRRFLESTTTMSSRLSYISNGSNDS